MSKRITGFLIEANVIKEDEAELYEYGLSLIGKKISHMLLILLIGWIGGQLLGMISFLASYAFYGQLKHVCKNFKILLFVYWSSDTVRIGDILYISAVKCWMDLYMYAD